MFIFIQKKIYPSPLSSNIIKILRTCYFRYFGHIWPRPPKAIACRKLMFICKQKTNLITQFFCRYYYTLKNPAIWLTRTKIPQGMGFAMESHFAVLLGKTNYKISNFFRSSLLKFGQKSIFHKNRAPSLFSIYNPLTSCKKIRKN